MKYFTERGRPASRVRNFMEVFHITESISWVQEISEKAIVL